MDILKVLGVGKPQYFYYNAFVFLLLSCFINIKMIIQYRQYSDSIIYY